MERAEKGSASADVCVKDDDIMGFDYSLWVEKHNTCVQSVLRLCELDKGRDSIKKSVKCNSTLCVMGNAMQDIQSYYERNVRSAAELCFLVRNVDVIITGIMDINNMLFGIGLNRQDKAIERCFLEKDVISQFRTLRSLILAHPVDTHFNNEKGESVTVYFEDVRPFNIMIDGFLIKEKCDYVKRMCSPETDESYFEPLSVEKDIEPVINAIISALDMLIANVEQKTHETEHNLSEVSIEIDRSTTETYIKSLDKELEKRYPSAIENIKYENGTSEHYSIIYECLMFFNARFSESTQKRYRAFLEYLKIELNRIEVDLQQMEYDEDNYFELLYCPYFAPSLSYEKKKMEYLRNSNGTSYTEEFIGNDTPSNALWGVRCFRRLIPYIEQYFPVDISVSDKELYCQYIAANYFCNISAKE